MKRLDIHWEDFLRELPRWAELPVSARRALLEGYRPEPVLPASAFGETLFHLLKARFLIATPDPERVRVNGSVVPFLRVAAAIRQVPVFESPNPRTLERYLAEFFTNEEKHEFCRRRGDEYVFDERPLCAYLASENWVIDFPNGAESAAARPGTLEDTRTRALAASLVRRCIDARNPVPLKQLVKLFRDVGLSRLGPAVDLCVRNAVLFPGLASDDLDPVIGVWPPVWERLHRPPAVAPSPVEPTESFRAPFLMSDLTELLLQCGVEPVRLRGADNKLFAKTQDEIVARFSAIPNRVADRFRLTPESRANSAVYFLRHVGFVMERGERGRDLRLEASPRGTAWLGLAGKERLRQLLNTFREVGAALTERGDPHHGSFEFLPGARRITYMSDRLDLPGALYAALKSAPPGAFIRLDQFLAHHRVHGNPFLEYTRRNPRGVVRMGVWRPALTPEEMEKEWERFLRDFLTLRMLPLGCISVGWTEKGLECFSVTDVGRHFIGDAPDFDYGVEEQARVIVQPNFDVVFMTPAPAVEFEIGRFAERVGRGVGVVFRITRKAVQEAVATGHDAEGIVRALTTVSTKTLPGNVEKEIHAWAGQCRRVTIQQALLVRCPDAETALRVLSALGKSATRLSETVVEIEETGKRATLVKKLREMGVFVDRDGP